MIDAHIKSLLGVQSKFHASTPARIFRHVFPNFDGFNMRNHHAFTATNTCIARIAKKSECTK